MFLTAELLLYYQRCSRRAFLDVYGDLTQRDPPSDYLLKLLRDSSTHKHAILADRDWQRPHYPEGDWFAGAEATMQLMQQGAECIHRGVLISEGPQSVSLLSCPDLLIKQPGESHLGSWMYRPVDIRLGKRPKLEYQIVSAFNVQVLAAVQGAWPETAQLLLRVKGIYEVDLWKVLPQMQEILTSCVQTLQSSETPEVFISRSRCNLCHWYSYCYGVAQEQQHLSLLPGVTASRYVQLQAAGLTTVESLAQETPERMENLPGFGPDVAQKLVLQAQSTLENRAIIKPPPLPDPPPTATIELYFDIESEPELNLAYLLGVLVVDRQNQTEVFHAFLAEKPEDEGSVWEQFLALLCQYPGAPVFHFCPYENQMMERLASRYSTPDQLIKPFLTQFIDLHERIVQTATLPVESYALKPIARWLGFDWRDPSANGAQAICWYSDWLETGDRSSLEATVRYNEDDCRAMYHLKNWMVEFLAENHLTNSGIPANIEIASDEGL